MTFRERAALVTGMLGAVGEGVRLRRHALRNDDRRNIPLSRIEPPETPMVIAAREFLAARCERVMANHSYRTGFWTMAVLHQHVEVTDQLRETAWVAALLHDVGLEVPPSKGDFSLGGVEVLKNLAREHRWSDEQTFDASQAIATNLSARVDPAAAGIVSWAMNVGGLAELGFPLHRAQMHPDRVSELEKRFERTGIREVSARLIREEAMRVPGGRFAFFRYLFPFITRG
ncbi:MAG TPA: hypothetical protein VMV18_02795 [bacterium]|nr:hypothetical protein [bacterium]